MQDKKSSRYKLECLLLKKSLDDNDFQKVIYLMPDVLMLSDEQMLDFFSISRPTLKRWRSGASSPHRIIRKSMQNRIAT